MKVGDLVRLHATEWRPDSIGVVVEFKKELVKVDWFVGMVNQPFAFWQGHQLEVISEGR